MENADVGAQELLYSNIRIFKLAIPFFDKLPRAGLSRPGQFVDIASNFGYNKIIA